MIGDGVAPLTQETPTECIIKSFCGCGICPFYKYCDKPEKDDITKYGQAKGKDNDRVLWDLL